MKKIIIVSFLSIFFASPILAATTFDSSGASATVNGVLADFKSSKQVNVIASSAAQTYAAIADHLNGTRIFGSSSGDSLIYFNENDKTAGTQATATELSASDSSAFTGANWSSL